MGPGAQAPRSTERATRRRTIRYAAAAASALTALVYLLIGLGVLRVVETAADAPPMLDFGLAAGGAFALGAVLLASTDRRILWVVGALLQVGVIVTYVNVASQRTPPFEAWGITIKVLQVLILAALAYLAVTPAEREDRAERPSADR